MLTTHVAIPRTADGVTAAFLTEALAARAPGAEVREAVVMERIRGASTKLRMRLDLNEAARSAGIPRRIIVKAGFEDHSAGMDEVYRNEAHAYAYLVEGAGVNSVRCLFAGHDETGAAMVILEDLTLRGVTFMDLQKPLSFDLAARFLDELARLHAAWWGSPRLDAPETASWLLPAYGPYRDAILGKLLTPEHYAPFAAAPRGAATPVALKNLDRIRHAFYRLADFYAAAPHVISHGDAHLGNLYTDADGRAALLDWQPKRAPWSNDVAYFLIGALDLPDRRRWEGALLHHYLARLAEHGVAAPGFDDAFLAYRRDAIWGFVIWFFNGFTFQSEANNTVATARFANALIDLDTMRLLD